MDGMGCPSLRKRIVFFTATLSTVFLASACGGEPGETSGSMESTEGTMDGDGTVEVVDAVGREVEIEDDPDRIVSMAPSVTETLFEVGAGDEVVGVTTSDDYPEEVADIETVGDAFEVNTEQIASMDVDVMFMSFDSTTEEVAERLERQTGAEVVVINPTTVDEAIESIGTVGEVVGETEEADALEEELRSDIEEVEAAIADSSNPTVFYELGFDPLFTVGPGSFVHDALEIAGADNVTTDTGQAYPEYSTEQLLTDDPEYYLAGDSAGATVEDIESRPAFDSLTAVEEGRVFVVEDALISRPGPRIADGIREVAETIHPDAFEE